MKVVLFTKFNETWDARELGEYLTSVGYDGVDLPVRYGYYVDPDNVRETLPEAVEVWSEMGLTCELISTETNLNRPGESRQPGHLRGGGGGWSTGNQDRFLQAQSG